MIRCKEESKWGSGFIEKVLDDSGKTLLRHAYGKDYNGCH
jgi:hypothetical protein